MKKIEGYSKTLYNCREQQYMTICTIFYDEWWRLFLENEYIFLENDTDFLDEHFDVRSNIKKAAEKYYGLEFKKKHFEEIKYFDDCIYLAKMNTAFYPLARIDENIIHWCVVHKFTESEVLISDIYYGETEYHFKLDEFEKSCDEIYEVTCSNSVNSCIMLLVV